MAHSRFAAVRCTAPPDARGNSPPPALPANVAAVALGTRCGTTASTNLPPRRSQPDHGAGASRIRRGW